MILQQTNAGQITPFWGTKKKNQLDQVNIDVAAIRAYSAELEKGVSQTDALGLTMGKASAAAKQFATANDFSRTAVNGFRRSQEGAIKSTNGFSSSLKSVASFAKTAGMALVNMGLTMLASFAITKAIDAIDQLIRKDEMAIEKANELADAWQKSSESLASNKKALDGISGEYTKLSKGVDTYGKNVSLTADEYTRYNDLANQIAGLFPDLVSGWTDEGNAILKVKGNIEELNAAYEQARTNMNDTIINQAPEAISGAYLQLFGKGSLFNTKSSGTQDRIKLIDDIVGQLEAWGSAEGFLIEDIASLNEILNGANIKDTINNPEFTQKNIAALELYKKTLENTANAQTSIYKQQATAYVQSSAEFKTMSDDAKAFSSTIINSLSPSFFEQFGSDSVQYFKWIQDNLLGQLANLDLSGIINTKSLFDTDKISFGEYEKTYKQFEKEIGGFSPEVQAALSESFAPDPSNLVEAVKAKLSTGKELVSGLSLGDLKIAANFTLDNASFAQLQAQLAQAKTDALQSIESLSGEIPKVKEAYTLLGSALGEQSESGSVSYETYTKLIAANEDFANAITVVDGQLQIDTDKAYEAADAHAQLQQSLAEAAQAAKQTEYDEVADKLEGVNKQLEEMAEIGYENDLYDNLLDQKEALESQQDVLERELRQYQAITGEIKGMTSAYAKFKRAQETPNQGALYDEASGTIKGKLKDAIKSKALNTDDAKSAIDFFVGEGDESQAGLKKRSKDAEKIANRYFTEKDPLVGLGNFQKDLLSKKKMGDLSKFFTNGKDGFKIGDGVKAVDIAKQLGMSETAVYSMLKKIEEYDADAKLDWDQLFPQGTEEFKDKETALQQAADKITADTDVYTKSVDDSVKRIEEANQKLEDALVGKAPDPNPDPNPNPNPDPNGGSTAGGGGSGSFGWTGGGDSKKPDIPIPTYVITVNAQVGTTLSGTDLLLGSVAGEDGSVTYTAKANGQVGESLKQNDLILNLNEDGTYDVFVDGTPGTQIGANSIVVGADENGNLSVTANGTAGDQLSSNDLIIGIDPATGQLAIATVAKVDTTTDKTALVSGLNTSGELDVPVNATTGSTVDKPSLVIGIDENGNYSVTANGKVGDAVPREGLLLNINKDGTYDVVANGTPGNTVSEDNLVLNRNEDGSYSVTVNGDAGEQIEKGDLVLGLTEDSWSVTTNASAGASVGKNDLVKGTTDGSYGVDVNASAGDTVKKSDLVKGTTDGSYTVDVDADTDDAMSKVAELQAAATAPAQKVITVKTDSNGDGIPDDAGDLKHGWIGQKDGGESTGTTGGSSTHDKTFIDVPFTKSGTTNKGETVVPAESVETATDQLNPFMALLFAIKAAWDNLFNAQPIPDVIEPTALDNTQSAIDDLDQLSKFTIPPKPMSLDTQTAYSQNYNMEQRLDDDVTKTIKLKYTGEQRAKGVKKIGYNTAAMVDDGTGAELIQRENGTFELGTDNGPRFTGLNKGDTVYTAEETKKILRRGVTPDVKVGRRFESGWNLPSPVGGGNSNTSSNRSNTSNGVNWKKYIDKLFDWIEIRLEKLQKITDKWTREIERAVGAIAKNKAIDATVAAMSDQIAALQEAATRYEEQAATIAKKTKLDKNPEIIAAIQNGTMDITRYDAKTQEKIKAYQEWWEKAQDVRNELEDLKDEQNKLINQKMDNIITQYEQLGEVIDAAAEKARANRDNKTSAGKEITAADYQPEINAQLKTISNLQTQYNALKAEFDKQLADGTLVAGSDAYFEYLKQLNSIDTAIIEAKTDLNDLNNEVKQIDITKLGYVLSGLQGSQNTIQGRMDLAEAQGRSPTTADYEAAIANGFQQVDNLKKQNELLAAQLVGLDKNSERYQEINDQINANKESINDVMISQEQWNDSVFELRKEELNKLKDSLDEVNDKYQSQKDLQQALEDLERARNQRKIRIYENGQFIYKNDTQDVSEKQRAVDEKLHDQTMRKIDEAIAAIEKLKPTDNVYAGVGVVPTSLTELFQGASIETLINGVMASVNAGASLTELAQSASRMASAFTNSSTVNSPSITVAPGAIQINGVDDANKAAEQAITQLLTKISNQIVSETYSKN